MTMPDPYFVHIQLFWPDGTRPNQNQIARVRAYDFYNGVTTWEGESGYDVATGGWLPIIMQNRLVFLSRGAPNLRFEVFSVQEQIVHSTQVFENVACGATVKITIGVGAEIIGGTLPTPWVVSGTVLSEDGSAYGPGTVRALDLTLGSTAWLGDPVAIGSDGSYSITYFSEDFETNGEPHSAPNLIVRAYDAADVPVAESALIAGARTNEVVDLEVVAGTGGVSRRVFGAVINKLGLPVSGTWVEAYHLAWTIGGLEEFPLGEPVQSDGAGKYEILYELPSVPTEASPCGPPAEQINLIVYARTAVSPGGQVLKSSEVIFNAPAEQQVNLLVDKEASSTDCEYTRLHAALAECIGQDGANREFLQQLVDRPEYRAFVALSSGQSEVLVRAYVYAQLIALDINELATEIPLQRGEIPPSAMYALVRLGRGQTLGDLLNLRPESFFTALVDAIHQGLVPSSLEGDMREDPSLLDDWRAVLAYFMTQVPQDGDEGTWQQALLELVFPANPARQQQVVTLYFDYQGDFSGFLNELAEEGFSAAEEENLRFVFELYGAVGTFFPIVAAIYADKAPRGWQKVSDLGRVSEQDAAGSETNPAARGWEYYAGRAAELNTGAYPPGVPGRDAEERRKVYAGRLYELFGSFGGTSRFQGDLADYAASKGEAELIAVAQFFADHPDFDLDTGHIDRYAQTLPESERPTPAVAARIKEIQRVFRVTEDFAAAQALVDAGLSSATEIAKVKEDVFIAQYSEQVGGIPAATKIHRVATQYASQVLFMVVQNNQSLNDTGSGTALPDGLSASSLSAVSLKLDPSTCFSPGWIPSADSGVEGHLPNWITLFGDLNKCACEHCQTVLSPGAYLVDLLQFVEGVPQKALFERRPDLQEIEITCPNTNRVVPYIDLVNELLEGLIASRDFSFEALDVSPVDPSDPTMPALEDTVFGLNVLAGYGTYPQGDALFKLLQTCFQEEGFALSELAEVKRIEPLPIDVLQANQEWIIEDDAWRFVIRGPSESGETFSVHPVPQTSKTNESLEVFPEHVHPAAYDALAAAVYPMMLPLDLAREEVDLLLSQKRAYRHEVFEAFSTEPLPAKLQSHRGAAAYLGLSLAETPAVLAPVVGRPASEYWGFPDVSQSTIAHPAKPTTTLTGAWTELLELVPVFLHRSGLSYDELVELLDTQYVHGRVSEAHAPPLNELGLPNRLHLVAGPPDVVECNYNEFQIAHLNAEVLRAISIFLRLWRLLGWSMREVDQYLMQREGVYPFGTLVQVSVFKRLSDELHLEPLELLAFFGDIHTRRSERHQKSLFDEVFLDAGRDQPEYAEMERIRVEERVSTAPPAPGTGEPPLDLKSYVQAALRLSAADAERLWWEVIRKPEDPAGVPGYRDLDLPRISLMYRVARLSQALDIKVSELYDLAALLGIDPFAYDAADPEGRIWVVQMLQKIGEMRRLLASGLSPSQVRYALLHQNEAGLPFELTDEARAAVLGRLSAAIATLPAAAAGEQPDEAQLGAALAKIMPADRVGRAVTLIGGPPVPVPDPALDPLGEQAYQARLAAWNAASGGAREFIELYFDAFLPEVDPEPPEISREAYIDEMLAVDALRPPAARYAEAWTRLLAAIREQAQAQAAQTLVTELSGLRPIPADMLVTRGLSSTDGVGTAAFEWKQLLGGGLRRSVPEASSQATLVGSFVVPVDGTYLVKLVVRGTDLPASIAHELADGAWPFTIEVIAGHDEIPAQVEITYDAGELKSGTIHPVSVTMSSALTLAFELRSGNADFRPAPSSAFVPACDAAYHKLVKAAGLLASLKVTPTELDALLSRAEAAGEPFLLDRLPVEVPAPDAEPPLPVTWSALAEIVDLLALNRSISLQEGTLFELWASSEGPLDAAAIAARTGWREDDLTAIMALPWPSPPGDASGAVAWNSPELWYLLRACMSLVRRLDLPAPQIIAQIAQTDPTLPIALSLRSTYRSRFNKDSWREALRPLRDKLRQRQRDALVGYLTSGNVTLADGAHYYFFDSNDLYAHLLVDTQMEPDTLISRIKLALNTVQLFVERVFLGLEDRDSLVDLTRVKQEWEWRRSYRVWEANRKVFLYPENWIEPELRDDKTPIFGELEAEILQDEISHTKGVSALSNYLEKLAEASNLEVAGSFAEPIGGWPYEYILHVVGKTRSRPRTFYYRTFQAKQAHDGNWTPWTKIDLQIEAEVVQPAVFNGRLFLFWPQVTLKQKRRNEPNQRRTGQDVVDGSNAHFDRGLYEAEIRLLYSSYLQTEDKWLKPRLSKGKVMDDTIEPPPQQPVGEEEPQTERYHLHVEDQGSELVSVALIRSEYPPAHQNKLQLTRLGKFCLRFTGHDSFEQAEVPLSVGGNWPVGTLVQHNAAYESDLTVEGLVAEDKLKFLGSEAFFDRTPSSFRVLGTNFAIAGTALHEPFFFETDTRSLFALNRGVTVAGGLDREQVLRARFYAFNHPQIQEIQTRLHRDGPQGIMDRLTEALPESENYYYNYSDYTADYYYTYYGHIYLGYHIAEDPLAWGTTQRRFEIEFEPGDKSVQAPYPLPTIEFGYGTPFGQYNWELFFHVPMLIADRLSQDLKFADAMNWYHFVFDPKQELNPYEQHRRFVAALPVGCRYWNFLPFFANPEALRKLTSELGLAGDLRQDQKDELEALIDEWQRNPFNPHLIARRRIVAYQKNVVMKYLDNLIAWADSLFRQDSFESINQATQLYILADELLGDRPELIKPLLREPRYTYDELRRMPLDAFSNALVDFEYEAAGIRGSLKDANPAAVSAANEAAREIALKTAYFRVPRNERLDKYWDTVQDRLFKIRNSMNIDGVKRQLALFQPPIDPALLVKAAAAGLDLGSVLSQLGAPLPLYRFSVWMQKATDLCNEVKSFGGALLSALEKRDAEALQLLRQGHEIRMLQVARKVRLRQIEDAEENIKALELSQALAMERYDEYRQREKINAKEHTQISETESANNYDIARGALDALAAAFAFIPDSEAGVVGPFPLIGVSVKVGTGLLNAARAGSAVLGTLAGYHRGQANLAGIAAGHDRRWEDWKFQERLAKKEMEQVGQQIIAANVRLAIAQQELDNHDLQVEHAEEVQSYLREKFSNEQLYQWMISQLSRTYQDVYKLAHDVAKTAERALQFELGLADSNYVGFDYRDSLRQGLLAGERMSYDLKRMDVAYLELNKREFELTKPISLRMLNPGALQTLRETGVCSFEVPEIVFDLDYPGQYFRRLKAVRVTIPCVTGPYTSVTAKLSLLGSAIRKDASPGPEYPFQGLDDTRFIQDLGGIQSIATSSAQNDSGLFELNFRDERYLPFEGAGAISRWRLELPTAVRQFDYRSISDVVLHLSYTARDAGGLLRQEAERAVEAALNNLLKVATEDPSSGLLRVISLKREFPDALQRLLAAPTSPVRIEITPEHFPYLLRDAGYSLSMLDEGDEVPITVHALMKRGVAEPESGATWPPKFALAQVPDQPDLDAVEALNAPSPEGVLIGSAAHTTELMEDWASETWALSQAGMSPELIDDLILVIRYQVRAPS